jgi:two-component system, cell cycle response regulator DivK
MARIVIIEDNEQSARLASRILKRDGHDVLVAPDGEIGLTTIFADAPDLILVDMGLPDMDGQTVTGVLRQQPSLAGVPIIAFTAWPEDTAHEMARAYGCDGVISKPIDTRTFGADVAAYLR